MATEREMGFRKKDISWSNGENKAVDRAQSGDMETREFYSAFGVPGGPWLARVDVLIHHPFM